MGRKWPAPAAGLFPEHHLYRLWSDIVCSFLHGLTWNSVKSMALLLSTCPYSKPVTLERVLLKLGRGWYCLSEKILITWQWQISVLLTEFITHHVKRKSFQRGLTSKHWEKSLEVSLSKVKRSLKNERREQKKKNLDLLTQKIAWNRTA